jgi:hypothetical protein
MTTLAKAVTVDITGVATISLIDTENLHSLIGSDPQAFTLSDDLCVYIDEDGKAMNMVATILVRSLLSRSGRMLLPGDTLSGTAVFLGHDGGDVPEWFVALVERIAKMKFTFQVTVNVTHGAGPFVTREALKEQLVTALDDADPGELDVDDSIYTVESWEVVQDDRSDVAQTSPRPAPGLVHLDREHRS